MKKFLPILSLLLLTPFFASAQDFAGIWEGHLEVQGTKLLVRFNIEATDSGLQSTMDIPMQGVEALPAIGVETEGNSITIAHTNIGISYEGDLSEDGQSIDGQWLQGGMSFPLPMKRMAQQTMARRPQEPKPPYPYKAIDITFPSAMDSTVRLAGTLTYPEGEGPFPAIVLVTGSGAQDRNEEILKHKPFLVIADHLTRNGYAVLRYDDRGVGQSGGSFQGSTTLDFTEDARGAMQYLDEQEHFGVAAKGVLGHSEGGLVALLLTDEQTQPDFLILMASPGRRGMDVIVDQNAFASRQIGSDEEELKRDTLFARGLFQLIPAPGEGDVNGDAVRKHIEGYYQAEESRIAEIYQSKDNFVFSQSRLAYDPWFRTYLHLDPADAFDDITCPVLVMNGGLDLQVDTEKDFGRIKAGLEGKHPDSEFIVFEQLNHLFQPSETGNPQEYGEIETTIEPVVLEAITGWLKSLE